MTSIVFPFLLAACSTTPPAEPLPTEGVPAAAPASAPTGGSSRTPPLPAPESVPYAVSGLANGDYAPEVALTDERNEQPFSLSTHLGPARAHPTKAAVVSFSASWCGPCRAMLPQLAELKAEHGADLLVLIVSIDAEAAGLQAEIRAVRDAGLDAPVVHAPEAVQRAWLGDTRNIPHLFILNQIGEVLVQDRGYGDNVRGVLPRQVAYALQHPDYVARQ